MGINTAYPSTKSIGAKVRDSRARNIYPVIMANIPAAKIIEFIFPQ